MSASPVIIRYARSLVQLAIEKDTLDSVRDDMRLIAGSCKESRELRVLLKSPVVKSDKKAEILNNVFAGKIGEMTQKFMDILVRKGREHHLHGVARAVETLYKEHKNILTVYVTSAIALDDDARSKVLGLAKEVHGNGTIDLVETVDPALIGGVIIRHGDEQWDGSVLRKLQDIKNEFSKNPYIAEI